MEFPKNDVRTLKAQSIQEAALLGREINTMEGLTGPQRKDSFNQSYGSFTGDMKTLYLYRSAVINVTCVPEADGSGVLDNVTLKIEYLNGGTQYEEISFVDIPA